MNEHRLKEYEKDTRREREDLISQFPTILQRYIYGMREESPYFIWRFEPWELAICKSAHLISEQFPTQEQMVKNAFIVSDPKTLETYKSLVPPKLHRIEIINRIRQIALDIVWNTSLNPLDPLALDTFWHGSFHCIPNHLRKQISCLEYGCLNPFDN